MTDDLKFTWGSYKEKISCFLMSSGNFYIHILDDHKEKD